MPECWKLIQAYCNWSYQGWDLPYLKKVQKRISISLVKFSIADVWHGCEFAWGPEHTSEGSEYGSSSEYAKALYKPGFCIYQAISLVHSTFVMLTE